MNTSTANADDASNVLHDLNALAMSGELREIEGLLANFNLFRVLRFEDGEIRHSNVLGWLLQPDESHGLKDAFLRRWLMRILHDAPDAKLAAVEVDALGIRAVRVQREWRTGDGYLDLLVRVQTHDNGEWVIAIENKVWSEQSENQLGRYRKAVERAFPNATHRLLVFLSRREQQPADPAWLGANYRQVREELAALLEEQRDLIGPEPVVLIRHYLEILEEASMSRDRIAELARTLYQNHRAALDAILEYRPDYVRDLSDQLADRVRADAAELKISPMLCQKYWVRFLPHEWDTAANRKGDAWGQEASAYVLCELIVDEGSVPAFTILEGYSPSLWREKLWEMSKAKKFPIRQQRTKQPKKFMKLYSVGADFEVGEDESPDVVATADKVWAWVKAEMKKPEFQTAVQAISEHLKSLPS